MAKRFHPGRRGQPPAIFQTAAVEERHAFIKERRVHFEQHFLLKSPVGEAIDAKVKRILKAQKWKRFGKHPGNVNITLVREFYAALVEVDDKATTPFNFG